MARYDSRMVRAPAGAAGRWRRWAGVAAAAVILAGALAASRSVARAAPAPKDDRPTSVALAPGRRAITGNHNKKVHRWNLDNLGANPDKFKIDHVKKVSYVATSATKLFTASFDGTVAISRLDDLAADPVMFRGHSAGIAPDDVPEVWAVVPSADGEHALSATNSGQILYWWVGDGTLANPPTVKSSYQLSDEWVGGLAFVPVAGGDETRFVSSHADGRVCVWQIQNVGHHTAPQRTFSHGNDLPVNSVVVARESANAAGKFVVSASFDHTVRIWDLANDDDDQAPVEIDKHTGWVWRVALSPDHKKIATAGEDGKVRLFGIDGLPYKAGAAAA